MGPMQSFEVTQSKIWRLTSALAYPFRTLDPRQFRLYHRFTAHGSRQRLDLGVGRHSEQDGTLHPDDEDSHSGSHCVTSR